MSMDLHMEHINRSCIGAAGILGSNINEDSVACIGKSICEIVRITNQFDKVKNVRQETWKHSTVSCIGRGATNNTTTF